MFITVTIACHFFDSEDIKVSKVKTYILNYYETYIQVIFHLCFSDRYGSIHKIHSLLIQF